MNTALSLFAPQELTDGKQNDSAEAKAVAGQSVMETVFDRFHINYEMSRTHKIGYYKESMSDAQSIYYLADGIVDIFIPSNLNQVENASISPIKTRKKAFKEINEENLLFGNASDMARSSVWRPNSFLSEKNRDHYTFSYLADTIINENEVSIIAFEPSKTNGKAIGKIYVDKSSFAILKIDYRPIVHHSKYWSKVSWTEEFKFKNGAYELSNVKFHGTSIENDFQYDAILIMDQLEVLSRIPENESYIQENVSLFEKADEEFTDSFWEGYDFLKRSLSAEPHLLTQN
ncbi:hypothetical protein [Ekhidna sp. To15]|uniref:hypothetical protein n=1 Tax=Ekhidna sp. To15 TaxID=3395267 RepID=UPI003F526E1D